MPTQIYYFPQQDYIVDKNIFVNGKKVFLGDKNKVNICSSFGTKNKDVPILKVVPNFRTKIEMSTRRRIKNFGTMRSPN